MSEMKSAWEIAMEKTDKLGKPSPEELKQQHEEKYALIGQSIADKFLGGLNGRYLEIELDKYPADDRKVLIREIISSLAEAIELGDFDKSQTCLSGIRYLRKEQDTQALEEQISEVFEEYGQAQENLRQELERHSCESLRQLGISGSAIATINPLADAEGEERLEDLARPYEDRLTRLRLELLPQVVEHGSTTTER
jgi:hypothetical protein